jgi:hypothetical protein
MYYPVIIRIIRFSSKALLLEAIYYQFFFRVSLPCFISEFLARGFVRQSEQFDSLPFLAML